MPAAHRIGLSGLGLLMGITTSTPAATAQPDALCAVAPRAEYGRSVEHAVPVGGGAMYASARERRYLDGLRGPKGEVLRYTRQGAIMPVGSDTLVDHYTVTYDGLAVPATLYLDAYHYAEPMAPHGFICARPLTSGLPEPDLLRAPAELDALAAEIAAAPGFRAGPVDLGGEPPIGLLFDAFRIKSRRIRVAPPAAAPAARPADVPEAEARTVVVAFPQTCDGRVVSPAAVALVGRNGTTLEASALETGAAAVRTRAPGQALPPGSVAAVFAADALLFQMQVRVTFADPACAPTGQRESVLDYTPAQVAATPMPARPAADTSGVAWVAVQAIVDHQGALQRVRAMGGPEALAQAAEAAVRTWTARPARASGAVIATPVTLQVTFTPPGPP